MLERTGCSLTGPFLIDLFLQKIFASKAVITLNK